MDMEIMEEVKDELTEEVEEEFKEEVKEVSEKGNKSSVKEEPKFRYFEVMLVGSVNVGKTKIFNQISKLPGKDRPTIGVESREIYMQVEDYQVKVLLWDTSGCEQYKGMSRQYYRKADGVILVYDITDSGSFAELQGWINEIVNNCILNPKIAIVAQKNDLEDKRMIDKEVGAKFSSYFPYQFYEISALDSDQVDELFKQFITSLIKKEDILQGDDLKSTNNRTNMSQISYINSGQISNAHVLSNTQPKEKTCWEKFVQMFQP